MRNVYRLSRPTGTADTCCDMPLFRDKREDQRNEREARPPPPGRQLLFDGPVLATWFLLYRLEQELDRSRRYGSPLSILVAEADVITGGQLSGESRQAAGRIVNESARAIDLAGWLDATSMIIVCPQIDAASARFVATRLRDEMSRQSLAVAGPKWQISLVDDLDEIQALLDQATADQAA